MKVVSWNCNGAFRKKFMHIQKLNADIYVIQECEHPDITTDMSYKEFATNYIWVGDKNKGLGIFARKNIDLINNEWKTYGLEWFLSSLINSDLTLLGLWGCGNYIDDIYVYLQIYEEKIKQADNMLIIGDFNSNSRWDKKHKRRSHSSVVEQLEKLNLYSCYHIKENEIQGKECKPTFFMYRNSQKPYHIDYCFYNKSKINSFCIGDFEDWISLSDHMPIVVEI